MKDCYIPRNFKTKEPRDFAYIQFSTKDEAEAAIAKVDKTELDGKTIEVMFATGQRKTPNEMRHRFRGGRSARSPPRRYGGHSRRSRRSYSRSVSRSRSRSVSRSRSRSPVRHSSRHGKSDRRRRRSPSRSISRSPSPKRRRSYSKSRSPSKSVSRSRSPPPASKKSRNHSRSASPHQQNQHDKQPADQAPSN